MRVCPSVWTPQFICVVRFAIIAVTLPSLLPGRDLTGTVYADHSGASGGGTGEVQLAIQTGIVALQYQKPLPTDFRDKRCSQLGAIWSVQTQGEELVNARCEGEIDAAVHSAWMAVLNHLSTIAQRGGYTLGFQRGRKGPINVILNGIEADISGYLDFPCHGMLLWRFTSASTSPKLSSQPRQIVT